MKFEIKNLAGKKIFVTNSFQETEQLGKEFTNNLKAKDIVFLQGDLGSGKTTFVKGVAKGLGVKSNIISPTFIFIRTYSVGKKGEMMGVKRLYHIDLYRIEEKESLENLGLEDIFEDSQGLTFIEWPEKLKQTKNSAAWNIKFKYISEDEREITINQKSILRQGSGQEIKDQSVS